VDHCRARSKASIASYNTLLAQHAAAEEWQQGLRLLATKEVIGG